MCWVPKSSLLIGETQTRCCNLKEAFIGMRSFLFLIGFLPLVYKVTLCFFNSTFDVEKKKKIKHACRSCIDIHMGKKQIFSFKKKRKKSNKTQSTIVALVEGDYNLERIY